MRSNDIIQKIRNTNAVRFILWIPKNLMRIVKYIAYQLSDDSKRLKELKGIHCGENCFIIGNGPSLLVDDLELIQKNNIVTFGTNRIFNIFDKTSWRPTYYVAVDPYFIQQEGARLNLTDYKMSFIVKPKSMEMSDKVININNFSRFKINRFNDRESHISTDVSKYFSNGYTVTFTAIQLAIYMGFKYIYLLGVDFNYSKIVGKDGNIEKNDVKDYFFGEKYSTTLLNYESTLHAYSAAREYCDANNIQIFNATRGGKLEVFERAEFSARLFK